MKRSKITSPGVLLILGILSISSIFLLDILYLRPHTKQLQIDALREQASQVDQNAVKTLGAEQARLSLASRDAMAEPGVGCDARLPARLAALTGAQEVWLTDEAGEMLARQTTSDSDLVTDPDELKRALAGLPAERDHGLIQFGGTAAVFARQTLPDPDGCGAKYLWLVRSVGSILPPNVVLVIGQALPHSSLDDGGSSHALWWAKQDLIVAAAWPATDAADRTIGYFRADTPVRQVHRQAAASRRTVLIILSLSAGVAALVILGVHILVAGPVYRLLNRLHDLPFGKNVPKDLTRDLHGEPLALARRLESAFDHLAEMSRTDELTGLANRRHFEQVMKAFYAQAKRYDRPLSLIALDVDFFKAVNDTAGHQAGDELLKALAGAITEACRQADLPARLGGDEFTILLPETACEDALAVAERIRHSAAEAGVALESLQTRVTLSMGIADLDLGGITCPADIMELADQALYLAKERGRDQIVNAHEISGTRIAGARSDRRVKRLHKKLAGLDTQFKDVFLNAMEEIVDVLESRDPHMADHARKVQRYASILAEELRLPTSIVQRIEVAAMLHDIGMLVLPDSLLMCPTQLDPQQRRAVNQHPLISVRIMEGMDFLEQEIPTVRYHHEHFDGSGYPEGLAGSAIPLPARILAVADVFDALTSLRPWRQAMTVAEALVIMEQGAGAHFDPDIITPFLRLVRQYGEAFPEMALAEASVTQDHAIA
ncbi:MAG: bifunctional diguanylate cyclase/phosphohydrolase [Planctomycetota bacterium]|jgi:diguanylate cyclase (GGDEF)-like protein